MTAEHAAAELPRYKCHKEVWALKIKDIRPIDNNSTHEGTWQLVFENNRYLPIRRNTSWMAKFEPKIGGYYVVYKDGYTSYSPAKEFEDGYTLIS